MHRIFHIKAYEKEHGPHFNRDEKVSNIAR